MEALSVSFRIDDGVLEHNNRDFLPHNVDAARTPDNVTYINRDLRELYDELFDDALEEYNQKQKRADRKIWDYYDHIKKGKQEKLFYELVVQFGDEKTCGLNSGNWELAKEMLGEYIREFEQRNPNMKVFCANLHLDEATPHLHIDFVPVCHNQTRGLKTRVSMHRALAEQGFHGGSSKVTEWAEWAGSERKFMTEILQRHDLKRDYKNNHLPHVSVEEYKKAARAKSEIQDLNAHINTLLSFNSDDLPEEDVALIRNQNQYMRSEITKQLETINSLSKKLGAKFIPIEIFDEDKMQYIIGGLEKANIPYIEGGTTLHIPDYAERVLKTIENRYSPENKIGFRELTALDIDLLVYNSTSLEELLSKLQEKGYEIKHGKYLAVKPQNAERFIRLISLGTGYTENNLAKRIAEKELLPNKFNEWEKKSDNVGKRFCVTASEYIVAVRTYKLTPKKHNRSSYYCFQNDAKIQRIFKQLITIDEFGFSSREQIYAKADELQSQINNGNNYDETNKNLTKVKELIAVYEEIIEGNYIDNLIKEQNKARQSEEQRKPQQTEEQRPAPIPIPKHKR